MSCGRSERDQKLSIQIRSFLRQAEYLCVFLNSFAKMQKLFNPVIVLVVLSVILKASGEIANIPYGSDPEQVFDLYLPSASAGDNVTKVVIMIHGGAWGGGNKAEMLPYIPFILENLPDHYVANMEYRLGTHESPGFPKQLEDIHMAISYIKASFAQEVDFALMGGSAGAHLSMLYDYAWDSDLGDDVKAVVNLVGPTDLNDPSYSANPLYAELFFALVGPCYYSQCPNLYNETSPVTHAHAGSAPTIGFYGNFDILVPNSQMPIIRSKLEELGVPNKFTVYPGGHGNWAEVYQLDMRAQVVEFLKQHL